MPPGSENCFAGAPLPEYLKNKKRAEKANPGTKILVRIDQ